MPEFIYKNIQKKKSKIQMSKSLNHEENFDLAHQTRLQFVSNSILIVAYLVYEEYVLCIYRQRCKGHAIK